MREIITKLCIVRNLNVQKVMRFVVLLSISNLSCIKQQFPPDIEAALKLAKANRSELVSFLKYYQNDSDTLKFEAAKFLVQNMTGSTLLDSSSVEANNIYFELLELENGKNGTKLSSSDIYKLLDSLISVKKLVPQTQEAAYTPDVEVIKFDFLKDNLEKSFEIWRSMSWSKNVSFDDFCNLILPYSCDKRYYNGFRTFFLDKFQHVVDTCQDISDPKVIADIISQQIDEEFTEDLTIFASKYPFLQPITFKNLLKGRIGGCNDINTVKVLAFRSLGIPVAFDWIPNWGNSNSSHFWFRTIEKRNSKDFILNENSPLHTEHIVTGSSYNHFQDDYQLPDSIDISYIRTIPKIYRNGFEHNPKNVFNMYSDQSDIPLMFRDPKLIDVTTEYIETGDLEIPIKYIPKKEHKVVYLLCFNNSDWTPVAWGVITGDKAEFKNLGKNIVYLPATFENDIFTPISLPFLFKKSGEIHYFQNSENTNLELVARMKYPYRSVVRLWANFMVGGRFQLANSIEQMDTTTIHQIDYVPFYKENIDLGSNNRKSRYLIYNFENVKYPIGASDVRADIGDIEIYGNNKQGDEILLSGRAIIGNAGLYGKENFVAFDSNSLTYFEQNEDSSQPKYIGIDLYGNPGWNGIVTKIIFYPRNDGNNIVLDDIYTLYYWHRDRWKRVGSKKGTKSGVLNFKDIPFNSLLLMKNENGKENRIFSYSDGTQFFW